MLDPNGWIDAGRRGDDSFANGSPADKVREVNATPEFWPAVAQIAPVLALALTIEARYFISRVRDSGGWFEQRWQPVLLVIVLVGLARTELYALAALTGTDTGSFEERWATYSIGAALVLIVLNPAVDLFVATFADVIVRTLAWTPFRSLQLRLMRFRVERLIRKTLEMRPDGEALLIQKHELQHQLRELNDEILALREMQDDPAKVQAIDEFLAEFDRTGPKLWSDDEMAAELEAFRAETERLESDASETRTGWRERREESRRESMEQQKAWVEAMRKEIQKRHGQGS